MSVKSKRNLLVHSDDRVLLYAGLFLICAVLAALGLGAVAFWCFLPAAVLTELLSGETPGNNSSRV